MPRKPRRERKMRFPGRSASFEKKLKFYTQENERLRRENSGWRYGLSSADKTCFCLLACESYNNDFSLQWPKKALELQKKGLKWTKKGHE
jgi:hypothetical protein